MRIDRALFGFGLAFATVASATVVHADATAPRDDATLRVSALRRDPHGIPRGLILSDGTAIAADDLGRMVEIAKPGDVVGFDVVDGKVRMRNVATGESLAVASGAWLLATPAIGGGPRTTAIPATAFPRVDVRGLASVSRDGAIRTIVRDERGVPFGFVLDDGAQVYMLPRVIGAIRSLRPGDRVRVRGLGTENPADTALWAVTVTRPDGAVVLDVTRGAGAPELSGPSS